VQRLEIGLDSHFFVDGEIFSPATGSPLAFINGGTAAFIKLR
jgi:hypothetical protein